MKTLLFLTMMIITSTLFCQNWFPERRQVVPMESVYTGDDVPTTIEYYTMLIKNTIYFNWVIKSETSCSFVIEKSDDDEEFMIVDSIRHFSNIKVAVWYSMQVKTDCNENCNYFRVVQVFDNKKVIYPSTEVKKIYTIAQFKSLPSQTERVWARF